MAQKSMNCRSFIWWSLFALVVILFTVNPERLLAASTPYMVKDLNPSGDSYPESLTNVNGVVYFRANMDKIYKTDGTSAGTLPLAPSLSMYFQPMVASNGKLFFVASDSNTGYPAAQIWKTDGTDSGTVKLFDANGLNTGSLIDVNGTVFFTVNSDINTVELWKTDGTVAGTTIVQQFAPDPMIMTPVQGLTAMTNVNGTLYFMVTYPVPMFGGPGMGPSLWKSNETTTEQVAWLPPSGGSATQPLMVNVNGIAYFSLGSDLWKSDGTTSGTTFIKSINPMVMGMIQNLTNVNGTLFFTADDGVNGPELWKSDGTDAGTVMVKDIFPGSYGSSPMSLVNINGILYFTAADTASTGNEVWKSDGTEAGTVMVKDINPTASSNPWNLTNVNGILYFTADDGVHGYELWKSDGTEAGTLMVADIEPGAIGATSYPLTKANSLLLFAAQTTANGNELWAYNTSTVAFMVTPGTVAYGVTPVNTTASRTVTLSNNSGGPLTVSPAITITGPSPVDNALFTVTAGSCGSLSPIIAAGSSCTITVAFTPTAGGARGSSLTIAVTDPAITPVTVSLTGSGLLPTKTLTVAKDGLGSGQMTLNPAAPLSPGPPPSLGGMMYDYTQGDVVELTAVADSGSALSTWTGCDITSGTKCTVTLTDDKSVTATFIKVGTVSVQTSPAGLSYVVDGTTYTSAKSFIWEVGTMHNLFAITPLPVDADHKYIFWNWGGYLGGAPGGMNTMPDQVITVSEWVASDYVANFYNEYELFISGNPVPTSTAGVFYAFTPTVMNPGGNPVSGVTFGIANKPSWAVFDQTSGKLSGTPGAGDVGVYDNIAITAIRGTLSAPLFPFSITITAPIKGSLLTARTHHTSTLLPNGKILVAGGVDRHNVNNFLTSAEIYDPVTGFFTSTGSLDSARWGHTATLLPNGKVLIVGGQVTGVGTFTSCELYDPATGTFAPTGSLSYARSMHTATLLQNGMVLISGSHNQKTAELYDPATGAFTTTGSMTTASMAHTAILMPDGGVLIAGGYNSTGDTYLKRVERFDPTLGTFTSVGNMTTKRGYHTATLLSSGKVLLTGGDTAELYDPAAGTFTATGNLTVARSSATATLLPNGTVLITGGNNSNQSRHELYDPATGLFTVTGALTTTRSLHTATLLPSAKVLIIGGSAQSGAFVGETELVNYSVSAFTATGSMVRAREGHTATLLTSGKVLVAGGLNAESVFSAGELFDPSLGSFSVSGSLNTARFFHRATLMADGSVLITGGGNMVDGNLAGAEIFDPVTGLFTPAGSMGTARISHTATLLPDGKVLITGGIDAANNKLDSAELYDPTTGAFTPTTGIQNIARVFHTATLLPDGKVLLTGGLSGSGTLATAELYDLATGYFTSTGNMTTPRGAHTSTLLPNGKVLIAGGSSTSLELYDPSTGLFTASGAVTTAATTTATLLPDGTVLLAGKLSGNSAERYDPVTDTIAAVTGMTTVRATTTATLLPDGKILFAGGAVSGTILNSAEVYDGGQGYQDNRRPVIASMIKSGSKFVISGSNLTGTAEGSSGTYTNSATNFPLVQLRRLDNDQVTVVSADPAASWSASTVVLKAADLASLANSPYLLTVYGAGVPSISTIIAPTATNVPVTVRTVPEGLAIVVDGASYTSPKTFIWLPGSNHTIATTEILPGATDTRYVFNNWSDSGTRSHGITVPVSGSVIYTATFTTQYRLTTAAGTGGTVTPTTGNWYDAGTVVSLQATAGTGYLFGSWTGPVADTTSSATTVAMSQARSVSASFNPSVAVTIQTSPVGRSFIVEGTTYTSAQTFTWVKGSTHRIYFDEIQSGAPGTRYSFSVWSDGYPIGNGRWVTPNSDTTYTANFTTQYQLTTSAGTGGSVTPTTGSWYDSGSVVNLQATTNTGYVFGAWTGPVANTATAATTVTMSQKQSVAASFKPTVSVTVRTNSAGRSFTVDGTTYTTPQNFTWVQGSSHTLGTVATEAISVTSRYAFTSWSDGGALSHTVTAPAAATASYTANFAIQYLLTTSINPAGTASVSQSVGGVSLPTNWLTVGTSVTLTAYPYAGYNFANWTGSATGTTNPTTVTVSGPMNIVANTAAASFASLAGGPGITKSGTNFSSRTWSFALINSGTAPAANVKVTGLTLTPTPASSCKPQVLTTFPVSLGSIAANGGSASGAMLINFSVAGCLPTTRYSATFTYTYDGSSTLSKTYSNQVQ